jgi:hypothetical protein
MSVEQFETEFNENRSSEAGREMDESEEHGTKA